MTLKNRIGKSKSGQKIAYQQFFIATSAKIDIVVEEIALDTNTYGKLRVSSYKNTFLN